jgi:hypothetical protein
MNDKRAGKSGFNLRAARTRQTARSRKRTEQAAEDDRRLDRELADSFPASDPPSIMRRGSRSTE